MHITNMFLVLCNMVQVFLASARDSIKIHMMATTLNVCKQELYLNEAFFWVWVFFNTILTYCLVHALYPYYIILIASFQIKFNQKP